MNNHQKKVPLIAAIILLFPFIAMQFTNEVKWSILDFVVAAILLITFGFLFEFCYRKLKGNKYRLSVLVGVIFIFILIWAELAVGIFGSPMSGS